MEDPLKTNGDPRGPALHRPSPILWHPRHAAVYLVGNGPLLASTIDEEHFAFLSLIYIIFSVATLVCVELKYNTKSCSYCLEFISFH